MTKRINTPLAAAALSLAALPAIADTINGGLTVRSRLCVGLDCADGGVESFGDEQMKLKESRVRLLFEDTSTSSTFPTNDWQLTANDPDSGGENYFALEDIDGATVPFRIDAGARTDALRVKSDGKIGIGTGLPVQDLHMRGIASAALRLEVAPGSSMPHVWDIINDGSGLAIVSTNHPLGGAIVPFEIKDGMGTQNALVIDSDGDIGMGTGHPNAALHVAGQSMLIQDNGRVNFTLSDSSNPGPDFRTQLSGGSARFSFVGSGKIEMELEQTGDLKIAGNYISSGTTLNVPDYVFADDYALRPLAEVQSFIDAHSHLPEVPSAADIAQDGLDMSEMQMTLLKKVEELTLYTLAQQEELTALRREVSALRQK